MNRKSTASICSFVGLTLLLAVAGCNIPSKTAEEKGSEPKQSADSLRFDPLELAADREVVPAAHPVVSGERRGETVIVGEGMRGLDFVTADSVDRVEPVVGAEAFGGQVFKVQLFTSKLFGEAKQARRVAEEIFDQPVAMDYEVPYFKVRVGSFADRYEAERYAQRVRAAGYGDAWVVAATVSVRKAAPLYDEGSELPVFDDTTGVDGPVEEPPDGE